MYELQHEGGDIKVHNGRAVYKKLDQAMFLYFNVTEWCVSPDTNNKWWGDLLLFAELGSAESRAAQADPLTPDRVADNWKELVTGALGGDGEGYAYVPEGDNQGIKGLKVVKAYRTRARTRHGK